MILNIGHRGAKGHIAENTLESIQKAIDLGVDGIEIDVHQCATGELIAFHDFTLDRLTNGSGEVSKHSLKALKELKVTDAFEIPTLEQVLDLIDRKCLLNIELKGRHTAISSLKIIENYVNDRGWDYSDFIISSFQYHELETVFNSNPDIPLAVLTKASVYEALEVATKIKAEFIHPNLALVTNENVRLAQKQGFKVNVWAVNEKVAINRMKSYGVNGIITDFPDRF